MEDRIVLEGIEEIGRLFLNRKMNNYKIESISAKDYGVNFNPIEIFKVVANSKRFILEPNEILSKAGSNDFEKKWINTVYQGSIRALYRANLDCFNSDSYSEVPDEKEILWDVYSEDEIAIIPDTSALMDGLISRIIEPGEEDLELNFYLSPTVIRELQQHAMGRQKQFKPDGGNKNEEESRIRFADIKRKSRIALRALGELVECRNSKLIRIKVIDNLNQIGTVPDWDILMESKSIKLDMPKYFITNDLIQSTLADLLGLKTRYMYPIHLLKLDTISLEGAEEVGKALYDLSIQFGEIILEADGGNIQFILQSDWQNKMTPSWVKKIIFGKIKHNDTIFRQKMIETINRDRDSYGKIVNFDPRLETLL